MAFVVDAFARRIVGWRVSRTATAGFVLDALEQALPPAGRSKAGSSTTAIGGVQYVSITYTERLAAARIAPSVGSVGDSFDNALAETVIGLFKTEVIRRLGSRPKPRSTPSWKTSHWLRRTQPKQPPANPARLRRQAGSTQGRTNSQDRSR